MEIVVRRRKSCQHRRQSRGYEHERDRSGQFMSDESCCILVVLRTALDGILKDPVTTSEQAGTLSSRRLLFGNRSLKNWAPVTVRLTSLNGRRPGDILVQLINMLRRGPRNKSRAKRRVGKW